MGPPVRIMVLGRWKTWASPSDPPCPVQWSIAHAMIVQQTQFGSDIPFLESCIYPFVANIHIFSRVFQVFQVFQDVAVFSHFQWQFTITPGMALMSDSRNRSFLKLMYKRWFQFPLRKSRKLWKTATDSWEIGTPSRWKIRLTTDSR